MVLVSYKLTDVKIWRTNNEGSGFQAYGVDKAARKMGYDGNGNPYLHTHHGDMQHISVHLYRRICGFIFNGSADSRICRAGACGGTGTRDSRRAIFRRI